VIYIGILTMNPIGKFLRCIESIAHVMRSEDVALITLLQENADTWEPARQIIERMPEGSRDRAITITSVVNLGCAGGRQKIVDEIKRVWGLQPDDVIVFLDDDIYAANEFKWLNKLTEPLFTDRADIAGVGGRRVTSDYMTVEDNENPDYVSGGWCAISGRVFLSGVQFDQQFNPNYWEDTDLCYQARARGFRIEAVRGVGLVHDHHDISAESVNLILRNRQLFMKKWENYAT
jgi:GT2 family glycosyltransferase